MQLSKMPSTAVLGSIPEGPRGIRATLKIMSGLVKQGKKSMTVRDKVVQLTSGLSQKDWVGEVCALHQFVRDNIRYLMDPVDVELVQTPDKTLDLGVGDCDDKSTLLCAMLESVGHPTRFVAIGFEPNVFAHVYLETKIGPNWVSCETTEPVEVGWQPDPRIVKCRMEHYN